MDDGSSAVSSDPVLALHEPDEASGDVTVCLPSGVAERPSCSTADRIGRHIVLEEVGRGGMGFVYRAYDPKLQREVALKEMRASELTAEARGRFEQEARAMARLSHPNVVSVYDVEALEDDVLVLVMEFVDGPNLRSWTRAERRSWQDILPPYLAAARGLHAAHEAGLLHRDFKPANVLVASEGAKVTDFGLAKTSKRSGISLPASNVAPGNDTIEPDADADALTREGQVMGTPRYMAPEQHRGEPLTTAADQFAFCVALWEAITRSAPYRGHALRIQKEDGPPEWPNAKGPRWLGDVLQRGLAPDPEDRWPSMQALIAALSRDPNARRRQVFRGASVLALMGVASGVAYAARSQGPGPCSGSEQQLAEAWSPEVRAAVRGSMTAVDVQYAESVWSRIDRRLDLYAQTWVAEHEASCNANLRKEVSAELADLRVVCLDRSRIALGAVVDALQRTDVDVLRTADTMLDELPEPRRCSDLAALREGGSAPSALEAETVEIVRSALELAKVDRLAGRLGPASSQLERVRRRAEALSHPRTRALFELESAKLKSAKGRYQAAAEGFQDALVLAAEARDWDLTADAAAQQMRTEGQQLDRPKEVLALRSVALSAAHGHPIRRAEVLVAVGQVLAEDEQLEEAERHMRESVQTLTDVLGPSDRRVASARTALANILQKRGQLEDAEQEYRDAIGLLTQALGPDHPNVANARSSLAGVLLFVGRLDDAESEARAASEILLRSLGPDHVLYGVSKTNLANVLADARRFAQAEFEAKEGLEIVRAAVGPVHGKTARALSALARYLLIQGKLEEAESVFREALDIRKKLDGPESTEVAAAYTNVGVTLSRQNRLEEAEALFKEGIRIWSLTLGPRHPHVAAARANLGLMYGSMGRYEHSKAQLERALELMKVYSKPNDLTYLKTRGNFAEALTALDDFEAAESERRAVIEGLESVLEPDAPLLALNRHRLARILLERGKAQEALEVAQTAYDRARMEDLAPVERGRLLLTLGIAMDATEPDREARATARGHVQTALGWLVDAGVEGRGNADEARSWLAAH